MSLSSPVSPLNATSGAIHLGGHAARIAAGNPWIERFARFGLIVRGIIYFVPGVFALQLALGSRVAAMTQTSAIEMIGHQAFGRALLVAVAVGLAGYALWGVIRAVFDPLRKGHSLLGIAKRLGFALSALAYAGSPENVPANCTGRTFSLADDDPAVSCHADQTMGAFSASSVASALSFARQRLLHDLIFGNGF